MEQGIDRNGVVGTRRSHGRVPRSPTGVVKSAGAERDTEGAAGCGKHRDLD